MPRVRPPLLVPAEDLKLDAECNRQVASALRGRAVRTRAAARELREETRALMAQAAQIHRRWPASARTRASA
jgi:hypothetical protein